jgi:Glycosyl hydrolases family 2, sugar binding domain/Glycosyl hydrolases family 2/Glycosyl hydrolases family 2, TIM barrel domain
MPDQKRAVRDIYAGIATTQLSRRSEALEESQLPPIPVQMLPVGEGSAASFKPGVKLETDTELRRELTRLRQRMTRFLSNHAPALDDRRITTKLKAFNWRVETEADRKNFTGTLAGEGDWTQVAIPHFGPPLGRAVTYYRATFRVNRKMAALGRLFVCFNGVDYKAHVFVNGAYLGSHEGFFAPFEFDFTAYAHNGANTLLVKVENDAICMGQGDGATQVEGDKIYAASGPGYDDPELGWHHCPPGMGIYQDVAIEARNPLFVHDIFVRPSPGLDQAEVWVEVCNCDGHAQPVQFRLALYGQNFNKTVFTDWLHQPTTAEIQGHGDVEKNLKPVVPQDAGPGVNYYRIPVRIPRARQWDLDAPWLYQVQVQLVDATGQVVDAKSQQFGMRTFTQSEDTQPKGKFYLNGREIRLRGANSMGYEQQCVMREDWDQLIDDILLARLCHMNYFRLTQRPVQKEFYEYCDRLGMMAQTDLPLFGCLRRNQLVEAVRQAEEMEKLIRPHACSILVSYINEPFPNGMGKPHRHLTRPELEDFFDMASRAIHIANPDRVIKYVDGDYDPPAGAGMPDNHCYSGWYIGHAVDLGKLNKGYWLPVKPGWHYGCGEFGAEGLESLAVMRKYYPAEWLPAFDEPNPIWSPDKIAGAQTGRFHFLWFETQDRIKDWISASQDHQAWVVRLMTEAFRRDARMNSFAWHLFIDAWPAGWMKTLVDVDRHPKKAFFAYREALTPMMVSLRTDRWRFWEGETVEMEAWICNDTHEQVQGAILRYQIEIDGATVQSGSAPAAIPECSSAAQGLLRFQLPVTGVRQDAVIRLGLFDGAGNLLHDTQQIVPVVPLEKMEGWPVFNLGSALGKAGIVAKQLGLQSLLLADLTRGSEQVLLIDDPAVYTKNRRMIENAVKSGSTAICLEWPAGSYTVAGDKVRITTCGMGSPHFVSCGAGHPLAAGFGVDDFKFWYDESVGYTTPLLDTVFDPPPAGWQTILRSGNGTWQSAWQAVPAVMEKRVGKGVFRFCQVKLAHRLRTNPAAATFARRLLFMD